MQRPIGQINEWEWIEQYWSGRLADDEKLFFEQTMNEYPLFAEEVASLRNGVGMLENVRMEQHLRQTLRQLHQADQSNRFVRGRWLYGGSGLVAACVGFLLFLFLQPVSLPGYENDGELIRDLNEEYLADSIATFDRQRKQAFDLFFEAQALFSEGQPGPAARQFEQVLAFPNLRPYFREAVQWHLVVCYLKTGQPQKAGELYGQLSNTRAYEVDRLDRWQIGWQIRMNKWFGNRLPQPSKQPATNE